MARDCEAAPKRWFPGSCLGQIALLAVVLASLQSCDLFKSPEKQPPNIFLAISDDQSWLHTSIAGDRVVKTPAFDRVAREGILFTHAFCAAPTCSPSRAALLTGQDIWRLGKAANLMGPLDKKFAVFPELLESAGYHTGYAGKGWGPGSIQESGRDRNPCGDEYGTIRDNHVDSFRRFLESVPEGKPFCFWFGSPDPHAPYSFNSGVRSGMDPNQVNIPSHIPATLKVRHRFLDLFVEIQRFDRDVELMLELLEKSGKLENTLVIITSDNGMDFPRGKLNLYDYGTRMPMAVFWPGVMKGGRVVDDLVSLTDLAPTFVELAGLQPPPEMTGRSIADILQSDLSGRIRPERDRVYLARERHSPYREGQKSYPSRAIRTHEYLYIRNFTPDRWPAGDPPHFADSGARPLLVPIILDLRDNGNQPRFFDLCYGKRPSEELYDVVADPEQLVNLAADPEYAATKEELWLDLKKYLEATGDPRVFGRDGGWDTMPWPRKLRFRMSEPGKDAELD